MSDKKSFDRKSESFEYPHLCVEVGPVDIPLVFSGYAARAIHEAMTALDYAEAASSTEISTRIVVRIINGIDKPLMSIERFFEPEKH